MQLLERDHHVAQLTHWLTESREKGGCIVLVGGEAGVGKTSLLQQFTTAQRHIRVLWGACDALFTPRPLAPLHDIARQLEGTLGRLLRSASDRDAIFSAALDELDRTPSLVIFEDMHWADEATLDLVKFLGRRIHRTRSMLLMSYRDDEVTGRHALRFVIGDLPRTSTQRLAVRALSEAAVDSLAKQAGRSAAGLHSMTGGNPLFVTEILAAESDSIPSTVSDAVLSRVARLTEAARGLAELVSIVPTKADGWLVDAFGPDEAALESCLSIGMVRHEDGGLSFRHELTRRALQDSLSQVRQQSLHARVLATLSSRADVSAARLAHHADGARDVQAVLRFAPRAGEEAAAMGAHREAACFYMIALEYGETLSPAQRAELLERRSYECYLTDQIDKAIDARAKALQIWSDLAERRKEGDTLRWLSRLSWFAGQRDAAEQYATQAIEVLERLPVGAELAMAYSNRAQLDMLANASSSAVQWARRAIELVQESEHQDVLSHALNNLGTARVAMGELEGWDDVERSLRIALEHGLHEHAARAFTNLSSTNVIARRYAGAMRWLEEGLSYCERRDLDSWFAYMRAWRARARFEQGDWSGAADDAEAVLRDPQTAAISRIPALIVLAHVRLRRGDPDVATPLQKVRELVKQVNELQRLGPFASVLAESAWLADDAATLLRDVRPAYELACERADAWMKGDLASWLWRAKSLTEVPQDIAEPYAQELLGDWQDAAQTWAELGCPYERACMLAWYGTEADKMEALVAFEALGAQPAAQKLRKTLRDQGVRGIPRGARPSTRTNEFGLTKREAQILELLSQGLRNAAIAKRLFLSTKTVDHHVSAILNKLGVSSRSQAIAMTRSAVKDK